MAVPDNRKYCLSDISPISWYKTRSQKEKILLNIIFVIIIIFIVNKYGDYFVNLFCSKRHGILPTVNRGFKNMAHFIDSSVDSTTSPMFRGVGVSSSTF